MKKAVFSFILFLITSSLFPQQSAQSYKFRVYLKDKGITEYKTLEPEKFLSKQAIDRKNRQGVTVNESDLPISADYFNLISLSGGKVVTHSKWFKTIVVQLSDSNQINNISDLSFVDSVKYVWKGPETREEIPLRPRLVSQDYSQKDTSDIMGFSKSHFDIHDATILYDYSFLGKGINIAVIDAGFTNVDVIPYFASSNIVEYKSFVPEGKLLVDSDHGTRVFSTISSIVPGKIMGSAPSANFYLFQSEEVASEFPVEEDYWVRAVEYSDSIGVDVINSSLGYNNFDDSQLNYTHKQLDGRSSLMSIAADLAYDKGMIIVTSAGNEGNKKWRKISVPGDAKNALTVGSVGTDSIISRFSSVGLTADNRIKPDIVSVGQRTITISHSGQITPAFGTSFSSPFVAGIIASLWSINPKLDRGELLKVIRESSDRYHNPDSIYGNGIPNVKIAMERVLSSLHLNDNGYVDDLLSISMVDKVGLNITLKDDKFNPSTYTLSIIDENLKLLSQQVFSDNVLNIILGDDLRIIENSIYLILNAPHIQRTIKLKM